MATNSTDFGRERHLVTSLKRVVELHRHIRLDKAEQARKQFLETLSQRVSERTGLPIETARRQVEAVAVSARKLHEVRWFGGR